MALLGYGTVSQETAAQAAGQTTPAITAGASAQIGSGGTAEITGSNQAGEITITTGTGSPSAGDLATVAFPTAFEGNVPHIDFQPTEANGAAKRVYPTGRTLSGFILTGLDALAASTTYKFAYQVRQP